MTVILWFCNQYVSYLYIVFGVPGGVFVKIKCFSDSRNCGEKTFMRFFRMCVRCRLSLISTENMAECQIGNVRFDGGNRLPALFVGAPKRLFGRLFLCFLPPSAA